MFKRISVSFFVIFLWSVEALADPCLVQGSDTQLCETKEVLFNTGEASIVTDKAEELGSVVAIYEYLRNNAEYSVYHGAHSSSLNSVLSMRGNDVDLSSSLIAMLRSQGIKSRYAVGNIKVPADNLANWLGVLDNDLAVAILGDQGVQNIDTTDPDNIVFEHVWVEALVNYENYRAGNISSSVACSTEGGSCKWVALDVSYKQKEYKGIYKTLLRDVNFDYDAYYNAENPASPNYVEGMKYKNPLEIYEEQALAYLQANHPGVSLEDVIDKGEVIQDSSGLLPASLPYEVVGTVAKYDSVEEYDAASSTTWSKSLTSKIVIQGCEGVTLSASATLAELSTKRLTITLFDSGSGVTLGHRLDGESIGGTLIAGSFICNGIPVDIGSLINVELEVGVVPGDDPVQVDYNNLVLGGYYLVASGGETSNWTQVKRAYGELLAADEQYPIVLDETNSLGNGIGAAYVDENTNNVADTGDTLLINHLPAQDALTGGLLYAAQSVYYTRLREESERYSGLKGIISPITAYLGVVSTTHE
ncbi:MAG: transglutaminase domain-containing protein, partial [Gammaproteobacteria bacterium]|nr:transglutaminase domain-containing protein [Gammaproteobacteria bacterium]